MSKKKNDGFNTPFSNLKSLIKDEPKSKSKPAYVVSKTPKKVDVSEEERAFLQAMDGVQPIASRKELPFQVPDIKARVVSEEAEAFAQLYDLVSGRGEFDITDTDEFISGAAPGVDARLLLALKRGDYAYQAHVDLHGMTRAEAKDAVDQFLSQSKRDGKRCVLIVHGRGMHSKDQIPVLKEQLPVWLNRGRMGKLVLAFCTARPHDGGAGAMYVLLRR